MAKRRLVVVGGGYAGTRIAAALDDVMDVTLIEQNEYFVHNVALVRVVVDLEWLKFLFLPYDALLRHGRVLRGVVTGVKPGSVTLQDRSEIPADDIVLATGSNYATPFKPNGSIPDLVKSIREVHAQVKNAQSVVIVGAGSVGLEVAGEIITAYPKKKVTIIGANAELLRENGASMGRSLKQQLHKMGVKLILGRRATDLASTEAPYGPAAVTLDDGTRIEADVVFPTLGATAVAPLSSGDAVALRNGRIRVNSDLSVVELPGVWAVGDAADTGDPLTIVAHQNQVPFLLKQLNARNEGKEPPTRPYEGWSNPPIIVPLGPKGGASRLPPGMVWGSWVTSFIKGQGLFADKTRKSLSAKAFVTQGL